MRGASACGNVVAVAVDNDDAGDENEDDDEEDDDGEEEEKVFAESALRSTYSGGRTRNSRVILNGIDCFSTEGSVLTTISSICSIVSPDGLLVSTAWSVREGVSWYGADQYARTNLV